MVRSREREWERERGRERMGRPMYESLEGERKKISNKEGKYKVN